MKISHTHVIFGRHLEELHAFTQAPLAIVFVFVGFLDAVATILVAVNPSRAVTKV